MGHTIVSLTGLHRDYEWYFFLVGDFSNHTLINDFFNDHNNLHTIAIKMGNTSAIFAQDDNLERELCRCIKELNADELKGFLSTRERKAPGLLITNKNPLQFHLVQLANNRQSDRHLKVIYIPFTILERIYDKANLLIDDIVAYSKGDNNYLIVKAEKDGCIENCIDKQIKTENQICIFPNNYEYNNKTDAKVVEPFICKCGYKGRALVSKEGVIICPKCRMTLQFDGLGTINIEGHDHREVLDVATEILRRDNMTKRMTRSYSNQNQNSMDRKRVFISYSWTNENYKAFVLEFAKRLVENGVDVILDRWALRPGQDRYSFMEQSIAQADRVLVMCDKKYADKANAREGGVGTETEIITPEVYNQSNQDKFIPVIVDDFAFMPIYLKSRLGIDYRESNRENGFEEILRAVYDCPIVARPQMGEPPNWIRNEINQPLENKDPHGTNETHNNNETNVIDEATISNESQWVFTGMVTTEGWPTDTLKDKFEFIGYDWQNGERTARKIWNHYVRRLKNDN